MMSRNSSRFVSIISYFVFVDAKLGNICRICKKKCLQKCAEANLHTFAKKIFRCLQ